MDELLLSATYVLVMVFGFMMGYVVGIGKGYRICIESVNNAIDRVISRARGD